MGLHVYSGGLAISRIFANKIFLFWGRGNLFQECLLFRGAYYQNFMVYELENSNL